MLVITFSDFVVIAQDTLTIHHKGKSVFKAVMASQDGQWNTPYNQKAFSEII